MQGKVEISGVNTAKLTVLKSDEMTQLLQRCKQGVNLVRGGVTRKADPQSRVNAAFRQAQGS